MRSNALAAPSFDTGNLPACRVVNDNRPMPRLRLVSGDQETCLENFLPSPHARAIARTPQTQSAPRKITITYGRLASGGTVYGYVGGNPIINVDPEGLQTIPWDLPWVDGAPSSLPTETTPLSPTITDPTTAIPDTATTPPDGPKNCDPCKGLRNQLKLHEQKLADYKANPYAHDNNNFLGHGHDQEVIDGRIRNLEKQIENFRRQLQACEATHGA
jgi:hypothetical protein